MIRVYSYQDPKAIESLKKNGHLGLPIQDIERILGAECWDYFGEAYKRIHKEMQARMPKFSGDSPVWCWRDMQYNPTATDFLIVADVPESRVLYSDFDIYVSFLGHKINQDCISKCNKMFEVSNSRLVQCCVDRIYENEIVEISRQK